MNHLEDYMTFMKLPKALRMRINNYYQSRYAGKWYDEKDVLKWVSSSLREVLLTIGNIRLFDTIYGFKIWNSFHSPEE